MRVCRVKRKKEKRTLKSDDDLHQLPELGMSFRVRKQISNVEIMSQGGVGGFQSTRKDAKTAREWRGKVVRVFVSFGSSEGKRGRLSALLLLGISLSQFNLTLGETPPEREATPQGAAMRMEAIVF